MIVIQPFVWFLNYNCTCKKSVQNNSYIICNLEVMFKSCDFQQSVFISPLFNINNNSTLIHYIFMILIYASKIILYQANEEMSALFFTKYLTLFFQNILNQNSWENIFYCSKMFSYTHSCSILSYWLHMFTCYVSVYFVAVKFELFKW